MVINQLNDFVVILLIVAALVSAFLGECIDASAIVAIVILNTVMGVVQENRAEAGAGGVQKTGSAGRASTAQRQA